MIRHQENRLRTHQVRAEEPGKKKKLFEGDMKTEKGTEIRRSILLSNMIRRSMAEVDKGIEVLTYWYVDCVRGIAAATFFVG